MVIEVFEYLRTRIKSDNLFERYYNPSSRKSIIKRPLEPVEIRPLKKKIITQNARKEPEKNGVETSDFEIVTVDTGENADVKIETIDTVSY